MLSNKVIPSQYLAGAENSARALETLQDVLVAAHINMDGDALGSLGAVGYILQKLGKRFALYSSTGLSEHFQFLALPGKVYGSLGEIPFEPRAAVYLDCGEWGRLGEEIAQMARKFPSVNIDHHLGGNGIGSEANFVAPEAAATAQLVAYVASALGIKLEGDLARCVALGLMTDTGGFCHGNTTADVFALCATLAYNGCNLPELREQLQNNWTLGRIHLWGHIFSEVKLVDGGQIAMGKVCMQAFQKFHCVREDIEGCVEWMRRIRGVKVAVLLKEDEEELCKFSLRSWGEVDVRNIAASLGGGGHRNAAGGLLKMSCSEAEYVLIETIKKFLR